VNKPAPLKILIVEDEAIVAADIEDRLTKLGYEVAGTTDSGLQATELALELKPDLVLMDILLRGSMGGTQAASRIARESKVPIVYLTGSADDETFLAALASAPFGYVLKPFEDRELQIAIEMALYKHRMERERESLIAQLQRALAEVKVLAGLLPICAWCNRIRDDHGYWQEVQVYLNQHATHSACPECAAKVIRQADDHTNPSDAARRAGA
jgi:two-component system, response regulator PdtaR